MLLSPQTARDTLNKLQIGRVVSNVFIVSNAFPIACRIVLKEKDKLNEKGILPIDYFGIKSMNSVYFPRKIEHHFEHSFDEKIYRNLAKYTLAEVEEAVGPLRYMVVLPFLDYISSKLNVIFKNTLS
jgi:hypothetical protein